MANKTVKSQKHSKQQGGKARIPVLPLPSPRKPILPLLQFPDSAVQPAGAGFREFKKWCFFDKTPGLTSNSSEPAFVLAQGDVVTVRRQNVQIPGHHSLWAEVVYQGTPGWVDQTYLDDYMEDFPGNEVEIPNPTKPTNDAAQYMHLDAIEDMDEMIFHNLCGELCVAFIVKKDKDPSSNVETVIEKWKTYSEANPDPFSYSKKALIEPTRAAHLRHLLKAHDYTTAHIEDFSPITLTVDKILSVENLAGKLQTHYLIALVKCRVGSSGELVRVNKIPGKDERNHWIVVDKITHNGTRVEVYNPFHNKRETYSYWEFVDACSYPKPTGLWVIRKQSQRSGMLGGRIAPQVHKPQVHLDGTSAPGAAQYMMIGGRKKTQLCGEFSVAYILAKSLDQAIEHWKEKEDARISDLLKLLRAYGYYRTEKTAPRSFSMESMLSHWKEIQPKLYEHHVGQNNPTPTTALTSILRAYGYTSRDYTGFVAGLTTPSTPTAKGLYLPSPGRLKEMLKTHFLIAGVGIDGLTGRLICHPKAVRHWVVVEKIEPVGRHYRLRHFGGNGGWVTLYNPFTNALEGYSYREFTDSMSETGLWDGLWVKREVVAPRFESEGVLVPDLGEKNGRHNGKSDKNHVRQRWPQKRMLAEITKRIANKKPPEIIPALLVAAGSGWSKEEIRRLIPNLETKDSQSTEALEKEVCKHLDQDLNSLPPEIVTLLQQESRGNLSLACALADALRELGILSISPDKKAATLEFPADPQLYQAAIARFIADTSAPRHVSPKMGPQSALKVANAIRPILALQMITKLENIRAREVSHE